MYASHLGDLGRFYVPERITENWIPAIRYLPEPPAPVRGAMNPWEQERVRVRWMAEEAAWARVQVLQREWTALYAQLEHLMARYNQLVGELDNLVGPTGLQKAAGIMQQIPTPIAAVGFVLNIFSGLFGSSKKKKAENVVRELEQLQAQISVIQTRMQAILDEIQPLLAASETVRSQQAVQIQADTEHSELLYAQRQQTERMRAEAHRAYARHVRPRQPARDEL